MKKKLFSLALSFPRILLLRLLIEIFIIHEIEDCVHVFQRLHRWCYLGEGMVQGISVLPFTVYLHICKYDLNLYVSVSTL